MSERRGPVRGYKSRWTAREKRRRAGGGKKNKKIDGGDEDETGEDKQRRGTTERWKYQGREMYEATAEVTNGD